MWIKETIPTKSGYYLTLHILEGKRYYKAFWFDITKQEWIFRYKPDVKYWWNVHHEYYVPCQMQEGVEAAP